LGDCGASSNVPVSGAHTGEVEGFTLIFFANRTTPQWDDPFLSFQ